MSPPPTKSFGGGPPPPPMPSLVLPVVQERSALLRSIEKGTKLKKTITNDKSAPLIGNSRVTNGSNDIKGPVTTNKSPVHTNRPPNGGCTMLNINEILAAGRPKLKPIGRQFVNESSKSEKEKTVTNVCENRTENTKSSSNCSDFNKGQIVCDNNKNNVSNVSDLSCQQLKLSTVSAKQTKNSDVLETRVKSADSQKGLSVSVPNHGKPNIAPKPPTLSLKLSSSSLTTVTNSAVTRAQSMRVPRSPTAASVVNNFPNGTVRGFPSNGGSLLSAASSSTILSGNPNLRHVASVRHGSTSSISSSGSNRSIPPPLPTRFGASLSLRPPVEPPPPPPPPSSLRNVQSQSLATNTTNNNLNNGNSLTGAGISGCGPPPPPTRLSSIRTDLEAKFAKHFHSIHEFPLPPKFLNLPKKYISRPVPTSTKQQAPLPPSMSNANTNTPPKCLQLTTDSKFPRSSIC